MHRILKYSIYLTFPLLFLAPVWAQDPTDILIIGHDAPGIGLNPIQIRADRDGNILWQKPLPLVKWGSDYARYGDRNQREDTFYLASHQVEDQIDGKNRLIKLDADGDIVWDIPFSGAEIYISANPVDGGLYAMERPPESKLHKLDSDGNVVWTKNAITSSSISTDPTSGGVYVCEQPNVLLKLATDGAEIWAKTLSEGVVSLRANAIDGGVYVGWGPHAQRYTYRLDADGNIMWSKFSFPSGWNYGRAVSPLDGSLFIGSGWPHRLAHVALDGAVLFNIPAYTWVPTLATAIDEMAVYVGDYAEFGIQKYDGAGNLMWQRFYGPPSWIGSYGTMGIYTGTPAVATGTDGDGDGVNDDEDNCPDDANSDQEDFDDDGLGDACDPDADADGDPGTSDCDDLDPSRYTGAEEICNDGIDNDCDTLVDLDDNDGDCDGDGVANFADNCPNDFNPGQVDTDGDSDGDACDVDDDGDGVLDDDDNCPLVDNNDQADFDGDGAGDVCDDDSDGDGIPDFDGDQCHFTANSDADAGVPSRRIGKNRWADVDGDGVFDTSAGHNPTGRQFTITDTGGCNCAQIIELCGYGNGHTRFGCSNSVMDWWTGLHDRDGEAAYQCKED